MGKQEEAKETAQMRTARGLHCIHILRDRIATFLSQNSGVTEGLIRECDANEWDEGVAYDLRAALFQLGCVLSALVLWDREALPTDPDERQTVENLTRRLDEAGAKHA